MGKGGGEQDLAVEEQVYRRIRQALMEGDFTPGDRLSIRRVAAALETSPMPARTALGRLVAEKALDVLPSGTAIVPRLTRKAFAELTALRLEVEALAVRLAAPRLTERDFAAMAEIVAAHWAAARAGDADAYLRADRDFLFAIYRAADAPMVLGFIETMWLRRGPLFWDAKWALLGHGGRAQARHDELLDALRHGRVDEAVAALRGEIEDSAAFLLDQVAFAGDSPASTPGLARLGPLRRGRPKAL